MLKISRTAGVVASVAAIGLFGAYAFAQQGPGAGSGHMGMGHGMMKGMGHGGAGHGQWMGNAADPVNRLSTLKTELGIKPDQVAAWDAYAKVVVATATERREHAQNIDRNAMRNMQPAERQQHFSAMQGQREAAQSNVKAAAEALLEKLDDAQKTQARKVLPGLATTGPGMRFGMSDGPGAGPSKGGHDHR